MKNAGSKLLPDPALQCHVRLLKKVPTVIAPLDRRRYSSLFFRFEHVSYVVLCGLWD